jgi:hypothetical protein
MNDARSIFSRRRFLLTRPRCDEHAVPVGLGVVVGQDSTTDSHRIAPWPTLNLAACGEIGSCPSITSAEVERDAPIPIAGVIGVGRQSCTKLQDAVEGAAWQYIVRITNVLARLGREFRSCPKGPADRQHRRGLPPAMRGSGRSGHFGARHGPVLMGPRNPWPRGRDSERLSNCLHRLAPCRRLRSTPGAAASFRVACSGDQQQRENRGAEPDPMCAHTSMTIVNQPGFPDSLRLVGLCERRIRCHASANLHRASVAVRITTTLAQATVISPRRGPARNAPSERCSAASGS